MRSQRTGREGGANATSGARVGTLKWPFAWGGGGGVAPFHADLAPKRTRIWDFLAELSSPLPLRALWALIKANKTKFPISDPGVSLYGISPPGKYAGYDDRKQK